MCQNYFYDVFKYRFIKNEAQLLILFYKNKNLWFQNNEKKIFDVLFRIKIRNAKIMI